jgi:GAF domain-containing protein
LATQLDTALESARLYEDTQDRASRDRLVSEVAGRIRETLDVDTVLRTAADEMYTALGLSEVMIRLVEVTSDEPSKVED